MRRSVLLSLLLILFAGLLCPVAARAVSKEEVMTRYEKAIGMVEQFGLKTDPSADIAARLVPIHEALQNNDFEKADVLLNAFFVFAERYSQDRGIDLNKEKKLYWLELYLDIFQKLAVLALLAFLMMQKTRWRMSLKSGQRTPTMNIALTAWAVGMSILFRMLDVSRYGDSVWAIFDMQIVFAAIAGLLNGTGWGLLAGTLTALFRWSLKPGILSAPVLILTAAFLGAFFSKGLKDLSHSGKRGFICGAVVGFLHGCTAYLPFLNVLPLRDILLSIFMVTLFEAAGVAVFFAVISVVLGRELKKDVENELLKTRLLFLQAQLRPHFLFNALNTASSICGRENALEARSIIGRIADFLRHTLERREEEASLKEETEFVRAYLDIEKARFGDRLKVEEHLQVPDSVWQQKIPLLVLQPLVENALRHGILKKEKGGTLKFYLTGENGYVVVRIEDDGPGRENGFFTHLLAGEKVSVQGTGVGVRNIHERLVRRYGKQSGLVFESRPGAGTRVSFRIPMEVRS